jgi:hypothetical protein
LSVNKNYAQNLLQKTCKIPAFLKTKSKNRS